MGRGAWILIASVVAVIQVGLPARSTAERLVIATLSDDVEAQGATNARIRAEIESLLEPEFQALFPPPLQLDARNETARAARQLETLYAAADVQLVIALGPVSTQALAGRSRYPKPTIGSLVIDPERQGFPLESNGTSGRENLTYVASASRLDDLVGELLRLTAAREVALLAEPELLRSAPGLLEGLDEAGQRQGVRIVGAPLRPPLGEIVTSLPGSVDAVLVAPLDRFPADEIEALAADLGRARLPSLAIGGRRDVELGLLASFEADANQSRIGRRMALQVRAVALGDPLSAFPVFLANRRELVLNLATARALRVSPRYDMLASAILVGEAQTGAGRDDRIDLRSAIELSIARNLDLRSEDRVVAAGREDVFLALAALLPVASIDSRARWIDDDRAFIGNPERRVTAGLSLEQVLLDEELLGRFSSARSTQRSIESAREEVRQDVIQATAIAYVDVLLARTIARIQRDNLRVTRGNLELAASRRSVGTGEVSEVYRWQSEEADAQRELIDAEVELVNARFELNRILDQDIEREQTIAGVELGDISPTVTHPRVRPLLESPLGLRRLRGFVSRQALRNAPELRALDAEIAAQRRRLASTRRDFYLPDFSLDATVDRILDDGGAAAGTDPADETEWTVGISATLPITEGGGRIAETRQASENLSRLRIDRRNEVRRVDERVRRATNEASASFVAIDLTRRSADASKLRLEIVTEQYKRGAIGIIDLLDAQNSAFTAEQDAANAAFEHMIDLFELQRSMGVFELFQTPEQQAAQVSALEAFLGRSEERREESR